MRSSLVHPYGIARRGASMTEFLVVAPVILFLGLGTVQAGLIYHGNTILNYATFEAARTGATRHALPEPMRRELAIRLAPLVGGDGSDASAALAIARSIGEMDRPIGRNGLPVPLTRIEVLNPTPAAFEEWGVEDPVAGRRVIPNSHLRHRHAERAAGDSGVTLRDANLLKIEVTHGLELEVPLVGKVLTAALALVDPDNAAWYAVDRLPLTSVATVRMQSDVWSAEEEGVAAAAPSDGMAHADGVAAPVDPEDVVDGEDASPAGDDACGTSGLGGGALPVDESAYADGSCAVGTGGHDPPGLPAVLADEPAVDGNVSPVC